MREIILDTETTGLDPNSGDRVVEIGAVEVLNAIPTGTVFHVYLDPERDMPAEAFRVHGLSSAFLADKPRFAQVADEFLSFLGGDRMVAHNAAFDVAFLNNELARCGRPTIPSNLVVDSLAIARRKHSGPNSLDALCGRYGIDASRRTRHGALLDAELLAEVYLELTGGRQAMFVLGDIGGAGTVAAGTVRHRARPFALAVRLTSTVRAAHAAFMATFETPVWARLTLPPQLSGATPSLELTAEVVATEAALAAGLSLDLSPGMSPVLSDGVQSGASQATANRRFDQATGGEAYEPALAKVLVAAE